MMREIYDKKSETVIKNAAEAHKEFVDQLFAAADEAGINTTRMTLLVGAGPALTNRMKNMDENITLTTMSRFAAAVGKKVKVELVDMNE